MLFTDDDDALKMEQAMRAGVTSYVVKSIVMQQKNISEEAAYQLLRKMAMERNAKLADIAAQVVDLAQALG